MIVHKYERMTRHDSICIINSAEPGILEFTGPILEEVDKLGLKSNVLEWRDLRGQDTLPGYRAVFISASPMGNNANFQERIHSFKWLKSTTVPVLGICAGHQFIGHLFGGDLIPNSHSEEGLSMVSILQKDPIFKGMEQQISVVQQHLDSISLPPGFVLLASSERCKVQGIRHPEKPLYGVQWHAEISSLQMIRNLIQIAELYKRS